MKEQFLNELTSLCSRSVLSLMIWPKFLKFENESLFCQCICLKRELYFELD